MCQAPYKAHVNILAHLTIIVILQKNISVCPLQQKGNWDFEVGLVLKLSFCAYTPYVIVSSCLLEFSVYGDELTQSTVWFIKHLGLEMSESYFRILSRYM